MNIPDAVAVASLDTHRLIVAVRNDGHADVQSNLAPEEAADVLRQVAAKYDHRASCGRAVVTGRPCPVHDVPASPSAALPADAVTPAAGRRAVLRAWLADVLAAYADGIADGIRAGARGDLDDTDRLTTVAETAAFVESYGTDLRADPTTWTDSLAGTLDMFLARSAKHIPAADEDDQPAEAEQAAADQPRRVLTDDEYEAAYQAARSEMGPYGPRMGGATIESALDAALAMVGILAPPPEPEPETCTAQFADHAGGWHQCAEDPDHDPAEGHSDGEWSWPHGENQARPEPTEDDAEAQR
ncbi:hypothetical protein ACFWAA_33525 [Streptomyces sp. NPDC059922]|uniref:hypothetical protein n=1 Tax=Streptomyces sp. NPDC059922 TaxID=3347005 RepID=UPI003663C596